MGEGATNECTWSTARICHVSHNFQFYDSFDPFSFEIFSAICFNEQSGSDAEQAFENEFEDKNEDDGGIRAI